MQLVVRELLIQSEVAGTVWTKIFLWVVIVLSSSIGEIMIILLVVLHVCGLKRPFSRIPYIRMLWRKDSIFITVLVFLL